MRPSSRPIGSLVVAAIVGLALLTTSHSIGLAAQQQSQRPQVSVTILLREGQKVTLNGGLQSGVRKGDKFRVNHVSNGKVFQSGTLLITKVYGTSAEATITEELGVVAPEDTATLEIPEPVPARTPPTRDVPVQPTRKPAVEPAPVVPIEPLRKVETALPLVPQFSDKASGVSFTFDYTNDADKVFDTGLYRTSAHLIFDDQDYRTVPITLTGNYNLDPGKTRSFSLSLTDFTVTKDKDAWPLKSGKHTLLLKFGGKQYGPLKFDWHTDSTTKNP